MSPSLASFGFIVFLGMFLPINSNLNLYMDAKETFRLLGEFAGYLRLGPGGTCFFRSLGSGPGIKNRNSL